MLFYCISLLSMATYAVAGFIRDSSQSGILITVGLLFFIVGTILRRHSPAEEETATTHTPIMWERAMRLRTQVKAPDGAMAIYPTAGRSQQLVLVRHVGGVHIPEHVSETV